MLEVKNTGRNENAFDGLVGWLEMAEESSEPEDTLTETCSKPKREEKKGPKRENQTKTLQNEPTPLPTEEQNV